MSASRPRPFRHRNNADRLSFGSAADRRVELARLDDFIATVERGYFGPRLLRAARARRRKVAGWVIG